MPRRDGTAAALAVGVVAGFASGLFGVGGGLLIVPGLVLGMAMETRRAYGTSLAAIVPIAAAGCVTYAVHGHVDYAVAALLVAGSSVGAVVGTHFLHVVPRRGLEWAFAVVLLAAAVRLYMPVSPPVPQRSLDVALALAVVVLGFATGVLAGLLGVGGGVVMVPGMMILLAMPGVVAKGTSLLVIAPTAAVGTLQNVRHRHTDLRAALLVAASGIAASVVGARVAMVVAREVADALFATLLVVVAVRLLLPSRRGTSAAGAATVSRSPAPDAADSPPPAPPRPGRTG